MIFGSFFTTEAADRLRGAKISDSMCFLGAPLLFPVTALPLRNPCLEWISPLKPAFSCEQNAYFTFFQSASALGPYVGQHRFIDRNKLPLGIRPGMFVAHTQGKKGGWGTFQRLLHCLRTVFAMTRAMRPFDAPLNEYCTSYSPGRSRPAPLPRNLPHRPSASIGPALNCVMNTACLAAASPSTRAAQ